MDYINKKKNTGKPNIQTAFRDMEIG